MAYNKLHKKNFTIAVKTGDSNNDHLKFAKEASKGEFFFNTFDKKLYMATTSAGASDAVLYNTSAFTLTPAPFINAYSISFDGAGDYVDIGAISSLNSATQFTISWWQKTSTAGKMIFAGGSNDRAQTLASGVQFRVGGTSNNIGSGNYVNGNWHQLTLTYNAGTVNLYSNGSSTPDGTATNYPTSIGSFAYNSFQLGQVANQYYFNGYLDEVAIWNTELASSEIPDIQANGTTIDLKSNNGNYTSSANLVHYWRGGDNDLGQGTTLTDNKGLVDGTLTGDAQFAAEAP
jgi:hypothetical protein